LIAKHREESKA